MTRPANPQRTRRRMSGFTLVELMIAILAGSFAIAGVYYLSGVSARVFNEQMRVSETQMSMRVALEQLRRDFVRAGYFGTRQSTELANCENVTGGAPSSNARDVTPVALQAVRVTADGSRGNAGVAALLNAPTNLTRVDSVDLWGNYATSDGYLVDPNVTGNPNQIGFDTDRESFGRSFFTVSVGGIPSAFDPVQFTDVWAVGRMVRVESKGRYFFRTITAVNSAWPSPTINVTPALPGNDCYSPNGAIVAPIAQIRYGVETVQAGGDLARLAPQAGDEGPGSERTVLVRREITIADGSEIANASRPVLDYAVDFQVDGILNTAPTGTTPTFSRVTSTSAPTITEATTSNPEQLRSVILTISSRTPEADPRLPTLARASLADPLRTFAVPMAASGTMQMNARVRTMRTEIFLPNLVSNTPAD